jgi:hypothetical protein
MAIRKIVSRSLGDGTVNKQELDVSASGAGTGAAILPSGTTDQRPGTPTEGMLRYNSTTGLYEQYTATGWQAVDAPPTVSNISGTINENTNSTLTITGTGFKSGSVVSIEGAGVGGTPRTLTTTFVSTTSLTAATNATSVNYTGGASFDVKVTNSSGLTGTLTTAGAVDRDPIWSTSAGTLATIADAYGSYSPIATLSASDPEGTSVTYAISSGSLPGNVTLNSSTGAISGDPTNETSASTTYSFVASATSNTQAATRSFNIIVNRTADGTSSARFATSAAAIKSLTGTTTNGYYWIQTAGMANPVQLWCDMNIDGGGYMRFWWHGRFEIDGSSPSSYPSGDAFGTADISTLAYDATTGFGRIPAGLTPTKLLAKGGNTSGGTTYQAKTAPLAYAIWTFNSGNSTSNAVLASMQSGTTARFNNGTQWSCANLDTSNTDVSTLKTPGYTGSENPGTGSMDSWYYDDTNSPSGSGKGFQLDDDNGSYNTTIGAGSDDAGSRGVDFFSWQEPTAASNILVLYWK